MLETTETAKATSEVIWWLEVLKILVPVLTTIGSAFMVGLWINKRSERYKNDLAKEIHRYQTIYPRRLTALEEILALIRGLHNANTRAFNILIDEAFYLGNEDHQEQDLNPVVKEAWKLRDDLRKKYDEVRVLLDADTSDRIEKIISNVESARSMVVRTFVEETDESYIPAKTKAGQVKAEELINKTVPAQIKELENLIRDTIIAE